MDTVLGIALLVIGTMVFVMVNKMFNIMYFGAKAIFGTWMACVIATGIVGTIFTAFIITYFKWIIGGLVVIAFFVYMGKKGEKNKQVNETTATVVEAVANTAPIAESNIDDGNSEFNVILASPGSNKMAVATVVREVTGIGVVEAKALIDNTPVKVKERVKKADADALKAKLEQAGANVIIEKATFA